MEGDLRSPSSMRIQFHYMKYIECEYTVDSKSKRHNNFVVKTCHSRPEVNYLLAGIIPVYTKIPKKYIQIYLR